MNAFRARSAEEHVINFENRFHVIMNSKTLLHSALVFFGTILAVSASALDDQPLFHSENPLALRDEWGVLHQMRDVDATDYAPRSGSRWYYYFKSRHELQRDPAYVASLQVVLRNRGYYCGPIDGVMSDAVSEAIARVQKSYVQRVTGTLTVPVRRALNLP
jgi:hypothetical protein